MRRSIVDYKKLTPELAAALLEKYPQGYGDEDIIAFKNGRGEWIEAVELRTDDILYLVKISKSLSNLIANIEALDSESGKSDTPVLEKEYDGSLETDLSLED